MSLSIAVITTLDKDLQMSILVPWRRRETSGQLLHHRHAPEILFNVADEEEDDDAKNVDRSVIIYTRQTKGVIVDKQPRVVARFRRGKRFGTINQGTLCWSN